MRLIHLTDLHLSTLDGVRLTSLWGKRLSGYGAWYKNRSRKHLQRMLNNILAAVRAQNADQILLTGDLIQIGLDSEIDQAREWLPRLGPAERVMLVPGNHDIYTHKSVEAVHRAWADYLFHGVGEDGTAADYPTLRKLGKLSLIGLNSARATPMFMANGRLGQEQLERLGQLLGQAAAEQQMVVLLIHHPPLPGMTSWRKALDDAAQLQGVLESHPPLLILHGHIHHNRNQSWGDTRIFCTASASEASDAALRVIDINERDGSWHVRMQLKSIVPDGGKAFPTIDDQTWQVPAPG